MFLFRLFIHFRAKEWRKTNSSFFVTSNSLSFVCDYFYHSFHFSYLFHVLRLNSYFFHILRVSFYLFCSSSSSSFSPTYFLPQSLDFLVRPIHAICGIVPTPLILFIFFMFHAYTIHFDLDRGSKTEHRMLNSINMKRKTAPFDYCQPKLELSQITFKAFALL